MKTLSMVIVLELAVSLLATGAEIQSTVRRVDGEFEVAGILHGRHPSSRLARTVQLEVLSNDGRVLAKRCVIATPRTITTRFKATRQATFRVRVSAPPGADHVRVATP